MVSTNHASSNQRQVFGINYRKKRNLRDLCWCEVIGNSIFCIGVIQDDKIKEKAQKLYSFLLSKMKKLLRCGRIQILVAIWFLLRKKLHQNYCICIFKNFSWHKAVLVFWNITCISSINHNFQFVHMFLTNMPFVIV